MNETMLLKMLHYMNENMDQYLTAVQAHLGISLLALLIAMIIGIPSGYIANQYKKTDKWLISVFQILRVIPSLAVLILLIPVMGTGIKPAMTALVLLAVPPILLNTIAGLDSVPEFMVETAFGMGMTEKQVLWKVKFPLALPLILAGIKSALIEIIASATLASKIGAGGLGDLIFTGLGLNRTDILLLGGLSVAGLSILSGFVLDLISRKTMAYKYVKNNMRKKEMKMKTKILFMTMMLVLLVSLTACGSKTEENQSGTIRVGTKDFTENLIVGELYALALENAGFDVERVPNIAGSIIHTSIVNDEIDLYPEYTGTGLLSILKEPMLTDPDEVYRVVKEGYKAQFDITWLEYSAANDGQGLVIRTDVAEKYGIVTISDLQKNASNIRFASQGEFDQREDGIPALETVYGAFDWKSSKIYDNGLKYEVLKNDEADVAPAYTTEGQLVNTADFTLLVDDKQVWPPYNLTPIVRNNILDAYPEIEAILNEISAKLDTKTITELNAKVDVDKEEVEEVAKTFFESLQ